jgi:RES domain-containing protein
VRVWRIAAAAHAAFDGEGARRFGSRWTRKGRAVIFASATLSLAALERFVHTDPDLEPIDLVALPIEIAADAAVETVAIDDLPRDWRAYPAPSALASIGERWLLARTTAVLSVPSVVIPHERNFIVNPAHAGFSKMTAGAAEPFSFDPRMWKRER